MAYIVMGRDECNQEFRPSDKTWDREDHAYAELSNLRRQYAEARSMWVEMLKDKSYYADKHQDLWDRDEWDMY